MSLTHAFATRALKGIPQLPLVDTIKAPSIVLSNLMTLAPVQYPIIYVISCYSHLGNRVSQCRELSLSVSLSELLIFYTLYFSIYSHMKKANSLVLSFAFSLIYLGLNVFPSFYVILGERMITDDILYLSFS